MNNYVALDADGGVVYMSPVNAWELYSMMDAQMEAHNALILKLPARVSLSISVKVVEGLPLYTVAPGECGGALKLYTLDEGNLRGSCAKALKKATDADVRRFLADKVWLLFHPACPELWDDES